MLHESLHLLENDPGMNQFINRYKTVSVDPTVRSDTDKFLAERFRESSQMAAHFELGVEEGKLDDARNMLLDGLALDKIVKYTKLPLETITL
jgi:hypothetical protein